VSFVFAFILDLEYLRRTQSDWLAQAVAVH